VVGRSGECNLALDDPLVSRRHAHFRIGTDVVWVEDLGSRNGVTVNGERIAGKRELKHLDRVSLGSEEMVIVEVGAQREARATGLMSVCSSCRMPVAPTDTRCPHCGVTLSSRPAAGTTLELKSWQLPVPPSDHDEDTRRASSFALLAGIADKALALGRIDEAERLLSGLLADVLQKAQSGKPPPEDSMSDAVRYALRLAEVSGRTKWLDWVFLSQGAVGKMLPAETIDELYTLVRTIRYQGGAALRDYVQSMRTRARTFNPREKFALQRLEGLERVVGA